MALVARAREERRLADGPQERRIELISLLGRLMVNIPDLDILAESHACAAGNDHEAQGAAVISAGYVKAMAAYNANMNRSLYAAAAILSDEERRRDGGAFWTSVQGTLCHILWADQLWMSRFTGEPGPTAGMASSDRMIEDFETLLAARAETDRRISRWAEEVSEAWLRTEIVWFSTVAKREMRASAWFLVVHAFNHQTHHRGQAHALITRMGGAVGDTDLFLVAPLNPPTEPL